MKKKMHAVVSCLSILAVLTGCSSGSSSSSAAAPVPASVTSTFPTPGAQDVPVNAEIKIQLDPAKPILASSVSAASVVVIRKGTQMPGVPVLDTATNTIIFNPTGDMDGTTLHTVTLTSLLKLQTGNPIQPFSFTFTTENPTAPQLTQVSPAPGAQNVLIGSNITATFSKDMNPNTITTATFLVTDNGSPITGVVSYDSASKTATFDPVSNLAIFKDYTVALSSGIQDLTGKSLVAGALNTTWIFKTENPPTVVSTIPNANATGFSVSSNIAATFSMDMDVSTITNTNIVLTKNGIPTPVATTVTYNAASKMATIDPAANLDFFSDYTVNLSSAIKSAAGSALAPFSWTFKTTDVTPTIVTVVPANTATNVSIGTNVVVTFSVPMDATTINATNFTLKKNGVPTPVTATITYDAVNKVATLDPTPALDINVGYTVNLTTGVKSSNQVPIAAFSSTFTTENIITPVVTATMPTSNQQNVALSTNVSVTFSVDMNSSTITNTSFTLKKNGVPTALPATISYTAATKTALLDPTSNLEYFTDYTVNLDGTIKSAAGVNLVATSFGFKTVNITIPTVTSTIPGTGAQNVDINSNISAVFAVDMNGATITNTSFTLKKNGVPTALPASVTYNAGTKTATLDPTANLEYFTDYTAELTTAIQSAEGIAMAAYSWGFKTESTIPTVTTTVPGSGALSVPVDMNITATFSVEMNPTTITTSSFVLTKNGNPTAIPGAVSYDAGTKTATLNPTANLEFFVDYTVNLTSAIKSDAGGTLAPFNWGFKTVTAVVPTVTVVTPTNNSTDNLLTVSPTATFSVDMDPATITTSSFTLKKVGNPTPLTATVTYNAGTKTATLDPTANLEIFVDYTAELTTAIKTPAAAGAAPIAGMTWNFKTEASPIVTDKTPAAGATGVPTSTTVTATFSKDMNAATITTGTFTLTQVSPSTPVTGAVTYNAGTKTATFTPSAVLLSTQSYSAKLTTGIQDSHGLPLTAEVNWTFTTANSAPVAVTTTTPADLATNVEISSPVGMNSPITISATFSAALDPLTVNSSTFLVVDDAGNAIQGNVGYSNLVAQFVPNGVYTSLAVNTKYTVTLKSGIQSATGTPLAADYVFSFTTRKGAGIPDVIQNPNDTSLNAEGQKPQIAYNSTIGKYEAVWLQKEANGDNAVYYNVFTLYPDFNTAVKISPSAGTDGTAKELKLTVTANGTTFAGWIQKQSANDNVLLRRKLSSQTSWTETAQVADTQTADASDLQLVPGPDNGVHLLWVQIPNTPPDPGNPTRTSVFYRKRTSANAWAGVTGAGPTVMEWAFGQAPHPTAGSASSPRFAISTGGLRTLTYVQADLNPQGGAQDLSKSVSVTTDFDTTANPASNFGTNYYNGLDVVTTSDTVNFAQFDATDPQIAIVPATGAMAIIYQQRSALGGNYNMYAIAIKADAAYLAGLLSTATATIDTQEGKIASKPVAGIFTVAYKKRTAAGNYSIVGRQITHGGAGQAFTVGTEAYIDLDAASNTQPAQHPFVLVGNDGNGTNYVGFEQQPTGSAFFQYYVTAQTNGAGAWSTPVKVSSADPIQDLAGDGQMAINTAATTGPNILVIYKQLVTASSASRVQTNQFMKP